MSGELPHARSRREGGDLPDGYRVESYMRPGTVCIAWRVMKTDRELPISAGFTLQGAAIESAVYHAGRSADIATPVNPVTLHAVAGYLDGVLAGLAELDRGAPAQPATLAMRSWVAELRASLEGHSIEDKLGARSCEACGGTGGFTYADDPASDEECGKCHGVGAVLEQLAGDDIDFGAAMDAVTFGDPPVFHYCGDHLVPLPGGHWARCTVCGDDTFPLTLAAANGDDTEPAANDNGRVSYTMHTHEGSVVAGPHTVMLPPMDGETLLWDGRDYRAIDIARAAGSNHYMVTVADLGPTDPSEDDPEDTF